MKTYRIILAIFCAAAFSACSLDEESTSAVSTPENFFRSYQECQSVVNGCYIPLKSIYVYNYFLATECVTDVIWCASGTLDAQLDISPVKPRFGANVWQQGYLGVQRCNFAVKGIGESTVLTDAQRNELLCEVKALRGFYYWTLTSFFGDVPFYFDDVTDDEVLEQIEKQVGKLTDVYDIRELTHDESVSMVEHFAGLLFVGCNVAGLGQSCGQDRQYECKEYSLHNRCKISELFLEACSKCCSFFGCTPCWLHTECQTWAEVDKGRTTKTA